MHNPAKRYSIQLKGITIASRVLTTSPTMTPMFKKELNLTTSLCQFLPSRYSTAYIAAIGWMPPAKAARAVYNTVNVNTEFDNPSSTNIGADNRKSINRNLFRKPKKSETLPQKSEKTIVDAELKAIINPISNKFAPAASAMSTITIFMEPIAMLIGIIEKYHAESSKTGRFKNFKMSHAEAF